jgi:hypothetical protein
MLMNLLEALKKPMPKKLAVCVGINDWPGTATDLHGCVNDAKAIRSLLINYYGFKNPTLMLDHKATPSAVRRNLKKLVAALKPGDTGVFSVSSHGTWVPDRSNDEGDGKDEALFLWGRSFRSSLLLDDDIRKILSKIRPGVHFVFIADTCHSGTMTRALSGGFQPRRSVYYRRRFVPPPRSYFHQLRSTRTRHRLAFPDAKMNHLLISGCKASQSSYDGYFGGKPMGALTYNIVRALKKNPGMTYADLLSALRKHLPSSVYQQTPQLEGQKTKKAESVFGGVKK